MLQTIRRLIPVFVLLLFSAVSIHAQKNAPLKTATEDYLVYDAVIESMFAGGKVTFDSGSDVRLLVIRDTTSERISLGSPLDSWNELREMFPSMSGETIENYEANESRKRKLTRSFGTKLPYVLILKRAIDRYFSSNDFEKGWADFYKRYPKSGGFITVSPVGFNKEHSQALVYLQHSCGGLCGTGHFVVLSKTDKRWRVDGKMMLWIS